MRQVIKMLVHKMTRHFLYPVWLLYFRDSSMDARRISDTHKTPQTKNTQLYKLSQTEMQLAAEPRVSSEPLLSLLASPSHNEITITKPRHIYTYSSELILTHIHHCQPTPSTINGIWWRLFSRSLSFSLSLPVNNATDEMSRYTRAPGQLS